MKPEGKWVGEMKRPGLRREALELEVRGQREREGYQSRF
jgi:hypothetical protein